MAAERDAQRSNMARAKARRRSTALVAPLVVHQSGYVGSARPARSSEDREPARRSRRRADVHGCGARQPATTTPCGTSDRAPSRSHVAHLTPDVDRWSPTAHLYLAHGVLRPARAPADASAVKAKPPEVDSRLDRKIARDAGTGHRRHLAMLSRAGRSRRGHLGRNVRQVVIAICAPLPLLTNAIELCKVRGKISWPPHSPI